MLITLILFTHGILFYFGQKEIAKEGNRYEIRIFLCFFLFSAYMAIARLASFPIFPLINIVDYIFKPVGEWIEAYLQ